MEISVNKVMRKQAIVLVKESTAYFFTMDLEVSSHSIKLQDSLKNIKNLHEDEFFEEVTAWLRELKKSIEFYGLHIMTPTEDSYKTLISKFDSHLKGDVEREEHFFEDFPGGDNNENELKKRIFDVFHPNKPD